MRWPSRFALKDRDGEERIRRRFLILPRSFEGDTRWRWLEWAQIKERITKIDVGGGMEWGTFAWKWLPVGFVDEEEKP